MELELSNALIIFPFIVVAIFFLVKALISSFKIHSKDSYYSNQGILPEGSQLMEGMTLDLANGRPKHVLLLLLVFRYFFSST